MHQKLISCLEEAWRLTGTMWRAEMNVTAPEWLTRHGCRMELASDGHTWFVLLGTKPQYALVPRPVGDKFGCWITQTNNGKPVDTSATAASPQDALKSGLEDLRKALGW
jgi:hypothetical protein